jgi:hypothetical protein
LTIFIYYKFKTLILASRRGNRGANAADIHQGVSLRLKKACGY